MSLKQKVRLELSDGNSIEPVYSAVDLRAWEGKFHRSALTEDLSVSMLSWLGWHAAVRQNLVNGPLKDWSAFDAVCESVEGVSDEEETDEVPTPPGDAEPPMPTAAGDGSSAP